jgi:hypothetical protein
MIFRRALSLSMITSKSAISSNTMNCDHHGEIVRDLVVVCPLHRPAS